MCAICDRQIRRVNGKWQRYDYEIREGATHFLGNRPVVTKRKDPSRAYGCKSCYDDLAPEKVRTTPYHREYKILHLCFALIQPFHMILVYTFALLYFLIP